MISTRRTVDIRKSAEEIVVAVEELSLESPNSPIIHISTPRIDELTTSPTYFVSQKAIVPSKPDGDESRSETTIQDFTKASLDHPYFDTQYLKLVDHLKLLCRTIKDELKSVKDKNFDALLKTAEEIGNTCPNVTRTIAVLGDTGVGKSALINSLLGCEDLAPEGQDGTSVTSFATEFRYLAGSETGYVVEVEYQTQEEICETLREYVWDAQNLKLRESQLVGLSDTEREKQLSSSEYDVLESKAIIAQHALQAVFGHHRDLDKVFARQEPYVGESAVTKVVQWSQELQWPIDGSNGKLRRLTDDAEDCAKTLASFTSNNLWPFLKVARVFVKSALLQHGVVLVDLPGLRDSNAARVKATQEYLTRVDHIFIVTGILRAASSDLVNNPLYHSLKRNFPNEWNTTGAKHRGLTIVCTRSEEMDFRKIKKDFVDSRKLIPKQEIDDLDRLRETTESHKAVVEIETRLRHRYMEARNAFVANRIQQSHFKEMGCQDLKVYCVSNQEYNEGMRCKNDSMVTASHIPSLRARCFTVVADYKLEEAQNFLLSGLPSLLQSIKLHTLPKTAIDSKLADTVTAVKSCFVTAQLAINAAMDFEDDCSLIALNGFDKSSLWADAATKKHEEFKTWHHTSYSAFVRNNGTHTTAARGYCSWNGEFSERMRSDLRDYWPSAIEKVEDHIQNLGITWKQNLMELASISLDAPEFSQTVKHFVPSIKLELCEISRGTVREIAQIRSKANEDNYTSYMYAEMLPVYRKAAAEFGTGMSLRQKGWISRKLQPELFVDIRGKIECTLQEILDEMDEQLEELRVKYLEKIRDCIQALKRMAKEDELTKHAPDHAGIRQALRDWMSESDKGVEMANRVKEQSSGKVTPV